MAEQNNVFTIKIIGLDEIKKAFDQAPALVEPTLQKAIEGSQALLEKARGNSGSIVPWRTGALTKTFKFRSERLKAFYFPTRFYAIYVHNGTGVYGPKGEAIVITAKNKKALFWPGAAHPVKSVTIKGIKPNPFMENIAKAAQSSIDNLFAQALSIMLRDIARSS